MKMTLLLPAIMCIPIDHKLFTNSRYLDAVQNMMSHTEAEATFFSTDC